MNNKKKGMVLLVCLLCLFMMTLWAMSAMDAAFMEWQMSQYDHAQRALADILDENLTQLEDPKQDFDKRPCVRNEGLAGEFLKKTLEKLPNQEVCHQQQGPVLMRYVIEKLGDNPCMQVSVFDQGNIFDYSVMFYRLTIWGQHQVLPSITLTQQSVVTRLGHKNPVCQDRRYFLALGRQSWRSL